MFPDINECTLPTTLPCQHGGTCVDHVNRYTCTCVAGYNGLHCETGTSTTLIYSFKLNSETKKNMRNKVLIIIT